MKIHIIGCSGSGKTYLAKALSEKYNIPHFDLDDIQWDNNANGYGVKMPVEKHTELLNNILDNENWIIEGVYYAWVGKCFEYADKIYVLNIPKRVYTYRIIKRAIKRKLGPEKGKKETLKSVYNLLKWTNTFQKKNMVEIRKILSAYPEKTVWLKNRKEVKRVIYGKANSMTFEERKALVKSYLGKTVDIKIDRPIGYVHKKENYSLTYPINYGYIPGVLGGDGEELDVYLLGVNEPVMEYTAKIIGIAHRENDIEDKLIAAPTNKVFYQNDIAEAIHFQEQYYKTTVEAIYEKSAGAVVYTVLDGMIKYLLIKSQNGDIGFPKGHVEQGENEETAALREIYEETSIKAELTGDFKAKIEYTMPNGKSKTVIYFTAEYTNQTPKHNKCFEHNEYMLLEYGAALNSLTFENTKKILAKADEFINNCKD